MSEQPPANPVLPSIVLDSYALLAHLENEAGAGQVSATLEAARRGERRVLMSLINLGEVAYITERERGLSQAQAMLAAVQQLPIEVLPVDSQAVFAAAHLKAHHRISFADAFAAAAAQAHRGTLLTGDREFQSLQAQIAIEWIS